MKSLTCTIALLLTTFWLQASPTNISNITSGQLPIAELLNADGTLNLTTGFTGSLNLAGFDVRLDECEGIVAASAKNTGPQAGEDTPALPLNTWSVLGGELNHNVQVIAVHGPNVYAGGFFTEAGGTPANYIAKWDGSNWTALGDGLNNHCYAIAVSALNGDVYVGGFFTTAGGVDASRIAKWNGSSWSSLGANLSWYNDQTHSSIHCRAIAISGNDIYIGGYFTHANGVQVKNIAKWNGTSWTALGTGLQNSCISIAISGSDVYVGGSFANASGVSAKNIAKWNGTSWSALGSGLNAQCMGIAISGSDVYVAGLFTMAGSAPANHVAKWNGSSWSALGDGLNEDGYGIAASASDVYVVGGFTRVNGIAASRIAKWNGSSWSALGAGLNGSTHAVAVGSNVYAGNPSATSTSNAPDPSNSVIKWEAAPTSSPNLIEQPVKTDETLFNVRNGRIGQSFTTGAVAKQLTHIDIQTTGPLNGGFMIMDLYRLEPATGDLTFMASSNSGGYGQGATTRFFKSQPTLEANTTYAFILRTNGWNFFQLKGTNTGGTHANGTAFKATDPSAPNNDPEQVSYNPMNFDLAFSVHLR